MANTCRIMEQERYDGFREGVREGIPLGREEGMRIGIINEKKKTIIRAWNSGNRNIGNIMLITDCTYEMVKETLQKEGLMMSGKERL